MKPKNPIPLAGIILLMLLSLTAKSQSFGTYASAVWISDCNQSNFYNTSGSGGSLIGPSGNVFDNNNFGAHTQNSGTLILRGAEVKTFKTPGVANVCNVKMYYRIYKQGDVPGSFSSMDLVFYDDCNASNQFPTGGPCAAGDQKWQRIVADGTTTPYAPINLTAYTPGNYVLEVYYDATGSSVSTTLCNEVVVLNNGGNNYKATFSIQSPSLSSTNPSSCGGTEGSFTISGLAAGATYQVSYFDDGVPVGPVSIVANGSGQVVISGLNAGLYSGISFTVNGCTTNLFTGIILSNPIYVPFFSPIAPFCAGSTPPTLPLTSLNGISGTWNPSVINNTASGSYTFTPTSGTCGIPVTINVTVNQKVTPTFAFGTSLTICAGGTVPTLPTTSTNGITGTWSPSVVDNQNSGTYTFTPTAGQCANTATFTVTVNPNITPTFSFGTELTICAGVTVPTLSTTSTNGITGTWSPSVVDNQNSGIYTFTPTAGQCATTATFTVTVNPNITPTFSFGTSLTICAGGTVPTLPTTSDNGITGTWSPSTVSNQSSGTYTFTPTAGQCATTATFTVTVNANITPTFSFGTTLTICAGGAVPTLPTTSTNGITGTWSPSVVDNQNSGTYTFTPTVGQCATTQTFTVTVNPNILPTFSFGTELSICNGATVPTLPTTSSNGITGTWSPATVSNQSSGTYTFTPTAGQCATTASLSVTVNPNVTPTFSFGTTLTICAGGTVPTLPTTSGNGITGTWSPATVSNQSSGTYTFTPTAGQCATTQTFTVTVNPNILPTFSFGTTLTICAGGTVPTLPTTSSNGITGTWSPSVVDNQSSGTYTFTPTAGQCATTATFAVTVNPNITPTFSFGTSLNICNGATAPTLPTTSGNGITGTWSPSTISNQTSGTYTFTPTAGQCATTTTLSVTVNANVTPTFSFGTTLAICAGGTVPTLPITSSNGITGTWSPATVSNQTSGTYTFTASAGQCATTATYTVTVTPNVTPAFSFGKTLSICTGGTVPTLPGTSDNGITGTWSPATVSNQSSGTYTFTPTAGQCANTATFAVTVNPIVTPTFSFGTTLAICAGGTVPALVTTSSNGVTGTWSPATVSNQASGTYTFTATAGQCATTQTFTVTVTPNTVPSFSFGTTLSICTGGTVPTLPTSSTNGVTGTWSPATVSNQTSGTYTFTATAGQCATTQTFTVTVNAIVTPTFSFGTSQSICIGATVPTLVTTSTNGVTGTWSPATVSNQTSGTYTFTPSAGQCATTQTLAVEVNPIPLLTIRTDTTINDGAIMPATNFITSPAGVTLAWTNSNTAIGLGGTGTGNVPSFTGINRGNDPISGTITVTPRINGCIGSAKSYVVTVRPLNKDVFVPNVFSPNGDGKNDVLLVYGNYIDKLEMRIFNQWGQQIFFTNSRTHGWDGRQNGKPQPVGVYVYALKAVMSDGKVIEQKDPSHLYDKQQFIKTINYSIYICRKHMKNHFIKQQVFITAILLTAVLQKTVAQTDPHFTQNYTYPMYINPAMTGGSDGDYRVSAVYRSQWGSISNPYRTSGVSFDTRTNKNIALGVNVLNQSAGDGGFNYFNAYGTFAYTGVKFGKDNNHRLVLALQAGLINRRVDQTKFKWGDQWNPITGYNASNATSESFATTNASTFDAGAGALYYDATPDKKANAFGGFSIAHINRPKDPIIATQSASLNTIPLRVTVHGGLSFNLSERTSIVPHALYMQQGTAKEFMLGTYVQLNVNEETDFMFGGYYRYKDAIAPFVGVDWRNFIVGLSYDANTSKLGAMTRNVNSFELSLSYIKRSGTRSIFDFIRCPRL
ncbi:MAG: PorP/SprF family type IX secretion system membrane protein [Lacibacter sp.]